MMIQLTETAVWDTGKPFEGQENGAKEYAQALMTTENKVSAEYCPEGFDGDTSNRFRQVFKKDGTRLTVNTYFNEGFNVKQGAEGLKYELIKL